MAKALRSDLRAKRLQAGLTQAELALRAGVSRQLVAAVEAGHNTPAVDAAISLARALGSTVEALFADVRSDLGSALGRPLPTGTPVKVGAVGDRLVACEMADHGVAGGGWAKPDGVLEDAGLRLFSGAVAAGLVVAGCDPVLGLAEAMLQGLGPRSLLAISAPTGEALRALRAGGVHGAVVHGPPGRLPKQPVATERWQLARWQVGLAVASSLPAASLEAVLASGVPLVHREPTAASQHAFERAATAAGIVAERPGPAARGHIDAARIAATIGGAAVTTEGAAHAFGLRFLALEEHTVEIWFAKRWRDHPGVSGLGELLASSAFTQRVAQFDGYDLTDCGTPLRAPPAARSPGLG